MAEFSRFPMVPVRMKNLAVLLCCHVNKSFDCTDYPSRGPCRGLLICCEPFVRVQQRSKKSNDIIYLVFHIFLCSGCIDDPSVSALMPASRDSGKNFHAGPFPLTHPHYTYSSPATTEFPAPLRVLECGTARYLMQVRCDSCLKSDIMEEGSIPPRLECAASRHRATESETRAGLQATAIEYRLCLCYDA
jgi:hypothetical protein